MAPFVVDVRGRTCREQTRRVSTPHERRRAQKSWAPTSRDPCIFRAQSRKSGICKGSSRSGGGWVGMLSGVSAQWARLIPCAVVVKASLK